MRYTLRWKFWNFIEVRSRLINDWSYVYLNKEGDQMLKNRQDRKNEKRKKKTQNRRRVYKDRLD